jgi:hypothetical protein
MAVPKKGRSKSLVKLNKINTIKVEILKLNKILLKIKNFKKNNRVFL